VNEKWEFAIPTSEKNFLLSNVINCNQVRGLLFFYNHYEKEKRWELQIPIIFMLPNSEIRQNHGVFRKTSGERL
jgi:hypothetical protein